MGLECSNIWREWRQQIKVYFLGDQLKDERNQTASSLLQYIYIIFSVNYLSYSNYLVIFFFRSIVQLTCMKLTCRGYRWPHEYHRRTTSVITISTNPPQYQHKYALSLHEVIPHVLPPNCFYPYLPDAVTTTVQPIDTYV